MRRTRKTLHYLVFVIVLLVGLNIVQAGPLFQDDPVTDDPPTEAPISEPVQLPAAPDEDEAPTETGAEDTPTEAAPTEAPNQEEATPAPLPTATEQPEEAPTLTALPVDTTTPEGPVQPPHEMTEEPTTTPAPTDDEILPSLVATGRCGGDGEYVFDIRNEGNLPIVTRWQLQQAGETIATGTVDLAPGEAMQVRGFYSGTVTLRLEQFGKPYASSPSVTCNMPACPQYGPFPRTRFWDGGSDVITLLENGPVKYRAEGYFPPDGGREFLNISGTLANGESLVINYPPPGEWGPASPEGMHESHVKVFLSPIDNDQCDTVSHDWDRYWPENDPPLGAPPVIPTPTPVPQVTATNTVMPNIPTPTAIPPADEAATDIPEAIATSTPTWDEPVTASGDVCPDWIVYHTDRTGDVEVFRLGELPPGKEGDVNLTRGREAVDVGPSLSPDREWIAFASTRDDNWEIYISAVAADDIRRLTYLPDSNELSPTWSPDGRYIVFVSDQTGDNDLYVMDLFTGETDRLTTSLGDDRFPNWSPDSRHIVFASDRTGTFELYAVDITTRDITSIQTYIDNVVAPLYSFDGDYLLFRTQGSDTLNSIIYVLEIETAEVRQISDANGHGGTASWSPDSSLIAYTSNLDGDLDVYVYEMATGTTRLLTDNTVADYVPTWICDSNTVVFTSDVGDTPEIYAHPALPIEAPAIDVAAEAEQLTDSPDNNVIPEGMSALRLGL